MIPADRRGTVQSGSTTPGLQTPRGSSRCSTARGTSTPSGPTSRSSQERLSAPTAWWWVSVPTARLGSPVAALTVPSPGSRSRHVYALPRPGGLVHPRLTDQPVPDDDPVPPDAEVQQLLDTVNTALAEPLTRADVVGSWVVSQDPR